MHLLHLLLCYAACKHWPKLTLLNWMDGELHELRSLNSGSGPRSNDHSRCRDPGFCVPAPTEMKQGRFQPCCRETAGRPWNASLRQRTKTFSETAEATSYTTARLLKGAPARQMWGQPEGQRIKRITADTVEFLRPQ